MSDAYRELVENLRAAVVQPADGGEATRRRILRDLPATKPRPRPVRTLLLVAAVFLVSTAFALYLASPAAREPEVAPARKAPTLEPPAPPPAPPIEPPSAPAAPALAPSPARSETPAARPARAPRRPASTPAATTAPRSESPPAAELAKDAAPSVPNAAAPPSVSPQQRQLLYIEAHRQHFRGSPQQALAAWDAFLASQPTGQTLLEARYNRAVTLVRLGRRAEAERALAAFARGEHGGFRQLEAQQLLRQIAP